MRYMLLITNDEQSYLARRPQEAEGTLTAYGKWVETMGARGILQGGERLRPTTDATTVQVRNGEVLTSDGPFAETKEQIGGYFVVDCKNLDEAIDVASQLPGAKDGAVEVRPIWEM